MTGSGLVDSPVLAQALLSCAAVDIWAALGPCWALPMSVLSGPAAAAGLALIGFARETTNSFFGGLMVIAASLLGAAIVAIAVPHNQQIEAEPRASAA